MKNIAKWTITAATSVVTAILLTFTPAMASLPVHWVVIAAGTDGAVAYSQGGNRVSVKSRVLKRCNAGTGAGEKCAWAIGKSKAFLIVLSCPVSASTSLAWGGASDQSLAMARAEALRRMASHAKAHNYLAQARDCVALISYGNGKISRP